MNDTEMDAITDVRERLPKRPDDAEGTGFARQLEAMKRRVARRKPKPSTPCPEFEWKLEEIEPDEVEEWLMSAEPPGYYLVAVQVKESFLADKPLEVPRISWCVSRITEGRARVVMGGQAPDWKVAQARAEAIWRVAARIQTDA